MSGVNGCRNCRYCKCYPGDYWTPDEYECQMPDKDYNLTDEEIEEVFTRVWENGEGWGDDDKPICPAWEEINEIDYPEPPDWITERREEMKKEQDNEPPKVPLWD